jgi:hypothetical protein
MQYNYYNYLYPDEYGGTLLKLMSTEEDQLLHIAESNTKAAFEAQCIRYLTHGEEYQIQLPPLPQEVLNGYWQMFINFKGSNEVDLSGLKVYPNPANDKLFIEYEGTGKEPVFAKIYNVSGNEMAYKRIEQGTLWELDTENWINGIYFVRLLKSDDKIVLYKVIIAH